MDRSSSRQNWKREISAGGVVLRDGQSGKEVLLIESSLPDHKGKWTFPKGWIADHGGETLEETAFREVKEEGGVEARILKDLGEIHYVFNFKGTKVSKTVHFYLMEYVSGDPKDHDYEVSEAKFVPLGEAADMLTYSTDKEIFQRAFQEL